MSRTAKATVTRPQTEKRPTKAFMVHPRINRSRVAGEKSTPRPTRMQTGYPAARVKRNGGIEYGRASSGGGQTRRPARSGASCTGDATPGLGSCDEDYP